VGVGEPAGLDTLQEPPERRGVGHVGGLGLTRTAGKHATDTGDTATDVGDDWARVARFRKDVRLAVVVDYSPLHRGLVDRHVAKIVANDGEDAIRAAEGGASGIAPLGDQQARFAVRVPHVGGVHQVVGNDALKWK
jgi:hypothetical protein